MMQGYGAPPSLRQEHVFLAEGGVQVTSARFVVYQQTYPIAALTSISPFTVPATKGGPYLLIVVFGFFALLNLVRLLWEGEVGSFVALALTGGITALGVLWARSRKDTYGVAIFTSGMQVRALTSQDMAFVQRVLGALNQAIASR